MDTNCAVHKAVDIIAKRWTLLILLEIHKGKGGTRRFSELKSSLPNITPKILSTRLRELEKGRMIDKRIDATEIPVKSIYSLTGKGKDLIAVLTQIKKWSIRWNPHNKSCDLADCKGCQR
jgi:DNA-binding HxlR family transcriptional regulator